MTSTINSSVFFLGDNEMDITEQALVDKYKEVYNSIPNLKSETTIRKKQRKMKKIRKELVENYGWTYQEAWNIMEKK